ncbi:DEXDc domain containing protein [uncultured Caudovirales phage]|uniref:DEXDc domain containing protein n=1 Tax=uncultured Caudovirales phage TaxID=2100421 RepID=A0A6J5LC37_9CAUD|nr:DEXDc domain containing protein [uncultured Caudovirales phage]
MKLDYFPNTRRFTLAVPRGEDDPAELMREHGLDMSETLSTPQLAVLFTGEPYAAVAFWEYATPRAQAELISLQTEIETSWARESQAHIDCPADEELWPFQKAGVEFALRRRNTLIGDQPGLGKTAQAICLANEMRASRVLIVCPASIRLQWARQIQRWSTMPFPRIVHPILVGRHGVNPVANWTVVSYDLARTPEIGRALARGTYDLLILDEAHYLKEHTSLRTRAVFGRYDNLETEFAALASRCGAAVGLTGTPLPNRPREAYTLARGLCFDAIDFVSEAKFRERFNPSRRVSWVDPSTGKPKVFVDERTGREGELQARLRGNFMVRRSKRGPRGVMPQLKEPRIELVHLEPNAAINKVLAVEKLIDFDPEDWEGMDFSQGGSIATARRMMGEAVAPLAAEYVAMLLEGGDDKIVLFGHHINALNIMEKRLAKWGLVRIDGSVSAARKAKLVQEFIDNPRIRVCLGNTLSMGTGTDGLQLAAQHLVLAEPDWVHGNNEQAIDRLDRGGQEGSVQADILVVPGSLAEKILGNAVQKGQNTHKALDRRLGLV